MLEAGVRALSDPIDVAAPSGTRSPSVRLQLGSEGQAEPLTHLTVGFAPTNDVMQTWWLGQLGFGNASTRQQTATVTTEHLLS